MFAAAMVATRMLAVGSAPGPRVLVCCHGSRRSGTCWLVLGETVMPLTKSSRRGRVVDAPQPWCSAAATDARSGCAGAGEVDDVFLEKVAENKAGSGAWGGSLASSPRDRSIFVPSVSGRAGGRGRRTSTGQPGRGPCQPTKMVRCCSSRRRPYCHAPGGQLSSGRQVPARDAWRGSWRCGRDDRREQAPSTGRNHRSCRQVCAATIRNATCKDGGIARRCNRTESGLVRPRSLTMGIKALGESGGKKARLRILYGLGEAGSSHMNSCSPSAPVGHRAMVYAALRRAGRNERCPCGHGCAPGLSSHPGPWVGSASTEGCGQSRSRWRKLAGSRWVR